MGCGTSRVKPARSPSQVTMESHQRTVAAYRRQRIARDMEQTAYLRAEAEVEKALMLKRCSVDERRPSYIQRVLEDLAEVEEGQEETEEEEQNPVITIDSASEVDLKREYSNEDLIEHTMYSSTEHVSDEDDERNRKLSVPIQDNVEILTENHNPWPESAFYNDRKELGQSCTNHISEEELVKNDKRELTEDEENYKGNVPIDLTENVMQNNLVATNEGSNSLDIKPEVHKDLDQRGSENEKVGNENRINENLEQKAQGPEEEALDDFDGSSTQPISDDALDLNTTNSLNEKNEKQ